MSDGEQDDWETADLAVLPRPQLKSKINSNPKLNSSKPPPAVVVPAKISTSTSNSPNLSDTTPGNSLPSLRPGAPAFQPRTIVKQGSRNASPAPTSATATAPAWSFNAGGGVPPQYGVAAGNGPRAGGTNAEAGPSRVISGRGEGWNGNVQSGAAQAQAQGEDDEWFRGVKPASNRQIWDTANISTPRTILAPQALQAIPLPQPSVTILRRQPGNAGGRVSAPGSGAQTPPKTLEEREEEYRRARERIFGGGGGGGVGGGNEEGEQSQGLGQTGRGPSRGDSASTSVLGGGGGTGPGAGAGSRNTSRTGSPVVAGSGDGVGGGGKGRSRSGYGTGREGREGREGPSRSNSNSGSVTPSPVPIQAQAQTQAGGLGGTTGGGILRQPRGPGSGVGFGG